MVRIQYWEPMTQSEGPKGKGIHINATKIMIYSLDGGCVCICVYVFVCAYVCVCVCVGAS